MKLHAKTIAILVVTLLLGVTIGALAWSNIHARRDERINEMRRQGGLYYSIDRYIDPVDSLQEARLRGLASAYQDTVGRFWRHYMRHRTDLMQAYRDDLIPILEESQIADLQPYFERITRMPRSVRPDSTAGAATDSTAATPDSTSTSNP
ncbi:MAG: hypothetical protein O3C45_05135 [Bacteroidetes bacterium]|nr:hypothetical protein [Bacteroidota bacterium]